MVRTRGGGTRKRPTASERRRRGKQVRAQPILQDTEPVNEDAEQVVHDSGNSSRAPQARAEMDGLSFPGPILQDTEPVNEDAEQVVHDSDNSSRAPQAQEEIGGSSFPGGPVDASLLKSFSTHVALNIWNGEERAVLKLVNHGKKLRKWVLNDQRLKIRAYVVHSGLVPLLDDTYDGGSSSLVSAFCERWQPETNSFHLPFGEMTITLDDVASILHIPVSGELICMDSCDVKEANAMLVELLGVSTEDAQAETSYCRGPSVRLHWLRTQFEAVTEQSIQFAARAYLLHLVGCTLFVDKSAVSVSVSYLALFRDLNVISSYSWGAACLAYLYRELGIASRSGVHQIAGNLTLLQAWIYEHFPTLNPAQNLSYHPSSPRAFSWKLLKYADPVPVLRERLEDMQVHEVCWDPYRPDHVHHPLHDEAFFSGCISCGPISECYHVERVMRQFGFVQSIPVEPLAPSKVTRGTTAKNYRVVYHPLHQLWRRRHMFLVPNQDRGTQCRTPSECIPQYMAWFARISHPMVQNPARRCTSQSRGQPTIEEFRHKGDNTTVEFEITLTEENIMMAKQKGLLKKFKLTTTVSTSNMHMFDSRGVIKKYDTPEEILEEFFHLRFEFYVKTKKFLLSNLELELLKMDNKVRFIFGLIKGEIIVNNRKRADLFLELQEKGFTPFPKKSKTVEVAVAWATDDIEENETSPEVSAKGVMVGDYDYLLSMAIGTLTLEKVQELCFDRDKIQKDVEDLRKSTPESLWLKDVR